MALYITALLIPLGVSANTVTLFAWLVAVVGAVLFSFGETACWLAGAILLQFWYLLDHVDGQLARYWNTDSLDGKHLDFMMHHTVNVLLPMAVCIGLARTSHKQAWLYCGLVWLVGNVLITVQHDSRYRTLIARLQESSEQFLTIGGKARRDHPERLPLRSRLRPIVHLCRKLAEVHVVACVLTVVAITETILADRALRIGQAMVAIITPAAFLAGVAGMYKSQRFSLAEREFSYWFSRLPEQAEANGLACSDPAVASSGKRKDE